MPKQNSTYKFTRPFVLSLVAAVAVPALMATPNAYAGDKARPHSNGNTYQADRGRENHTARSHRRYNRENLHRRNDRSERLHRRHDRQEAREHRRHDRAHRRADRRNLHRRDNRHRRHQARHHNNYRPYWNNRRHTDWNDHHNNRHHTGWNDHHNGYQTSYRSSLGISFFFGQPGYSRYRWAPSRYSYFQPGYMSFANYQAITQCQRIIVDGFHHGHAEQVSVLQCSNPYDGTYIVQGSEQVEQCYGAPRYDQPYYRR